MATCTSRPRQNVLFYGQDMSASDAWKVSGRQLYRKSEYEPFLIAHQNIEASNFKTLLIQDLRNYTFSVDTFIGPPAYGNRFIFENGEVQLFSDLQVLNRVIPRSFAYHSEVSMEQQLLANDNYDMELVSNWLCLCHHDLYYKFLIKSGLRHDINRPFVQVPSIYRNWIYQILSSSRLSLSTIVTSVLYAEQRLRSILQGNTSGNRFFGSRNICKLLSNDDNVLYYITILALVLASKFMDDNTITNKSWSEISGISLKKISVLEQEWLEDIRWALRLNLDTTASKTPLISDYFRWFDHWCIYSNKYSSAVMFYR